VGENKFSKGHSDTNRISNNLNKQEVEIPYFANKNNSCESVLLKNDRKSRVTTNYLSLASLGIMGEGAPSFSQCVGLER
jgi:hypothetical protein